MSMTPALTARPPQRRRGHARVAAVLDAAAAVFREKGYDAATMTEIAARSDTAFGSLYRFFLSKEALADALLAHHAQRALDGLAALAETAPGCSAGAMAEALVDFALALQAERSFVIAVMDARGRTADKGAHFRAAFQAGLTSIVRRMVPAVSEAQAATIAIVLRHALKGIVHAAQDAPGDRGLLAEYRHLVERYLAGLS